MPGRAVVVASASLPLEENRLQFERCLPMHMRTLFRHAPSATLSRNVAENWLRSADGQEVTLEDSTSPLPNGASTLFHLSRVAFSRFRREGFVWVEQVSCTSTGGTLRCGDREGNLLRAVQDGDRWQIEPTDCHTLAFSDHPE